MTLVTQSLGRWWTANPGWVNFIYFNLAVFVSLYADRLRRLVILPVLLPLKGMLHVMERDLDRQLEIMRFVEDSPFKLIVYLAYYCVDSLILRR